MIYTEFITGLKLHYMVFIQRDIQYWNALGEITEVFKAGIGCSVHVIQV